MKTIKCVSERVFKITIATFLLIGAIGFIAIGFTLLPLIGFIVAIPFIVLAFYFWNARLDDRCEINFSNHYTLFLNQVYFVPISCPTTDPFGKKLSLPHF